MDKYEYKVRADEIKELIGRGEYAQAAEIADTIDWRRVKSVMMLCTISDLYKINRRYNDAKNMLLLAYERRPGGRTICYSLCELCIKTEEFVQAVNYYKEFVQVAPKDSGRYILQYKLYEAQDVSLEERIGVLEELKKRDYREKWAYELAYLYHRVGLATRCVEECDELILWFGEGKYVVKAMELKMLHQPLTAQQQEWYDHRFESPSLRDQLEEVQQPYEEERPYGEAVQEQGYAEDALGGDTVVYENIRRHEEGQDGQTPAPASEELDIHVKTMDMGQYNTLNLQAELAAGLREVLGDEKTRNAAITRSIMAPMMDTESLDDPVLEDEDISEDDLDDGVEQIESTEVFFGETGELMVHQPEPELQEMSPEPAGQTAQTGNFQSAQPVPSAGGKEPVASPGLSAGVNASAASPVPPAGANVSAASPIPPAEVNASAASSVLPAGANASAASSVEPAGAKEPALQTQQADKPQPEQMVLTAQPPKELAEVLSQESDGQLSMVVPKQEPMEQQITGQMSIQDILSEWERMKREGEERRKEEVRQRVLQQTGEMFTEFEASVRDGLLEQLESGEVEEPAAVESAAEADAPAGEQAPAEENAAEEDPAQEDLGEVEELEEIEETGSTEENGTSEEEDDGDFEYYPGAQEDLPQEEEEASAEEADPQDGEENAGQEQEDTEEETGETGEAGEAQEDQEQPQREKEKVRALTREERELFAPYIHSRSSREQLVKALDNISMAAYTGNVIITGGEGMDTATLAKNMIRDLQVTDSNFSGKVARISGQSLNKKDVAQTLEQLKNGALIIQKASGMNSETAAALHSQLQRESLGIVVVLEDTTKAMGKFLEENKELEESFTARMDVEALSNDVLVAYGRKYAKEKEYSIDELGVLALHTRIEELQTIDHAVTVMEVREIVDEAIRHATRKTLGHFVDILLAKRYDEEDMIVLTEKDFG